MIIYCVTVAIARQVRDEWLKWMKEVHVPDVMRTGYFTYSSLNYVLEPNSDPHSVLYDIRYECESKERLMQYQQNAAPALQAEHSKRFEGNFTASRRVTTRVAFSRNGID